MALGVPSRAPATQVGSQPGRSQAVDPTPGGYGISAYLGIARSWDRLHPKLTHRSFWSAADGTLPIVEA